MVAPAAYAFAAVLLFGWFARGFNWHGFGRLRFFGVVSLPCGHASMGSHRPWAW